MCSRQRYIPGAMMCEEASATNRFTESSKMKAHCNNTHIPGAETIDSAPPCNRCRLERAGVVFISIEPRVSPPALASA